MLHNKVFRKASIVVLLGLFTLAAGCSSNKNDYGTNTGGGGNPPSNQVYMSGTSFSPASLSVNKGTTVKWTNQDPYDHTVTSGTVGSPSGVFDSGNVGSGGTFTYTFNTSGTFKYYCRIHGAAMTGTVVVQ